jgi:L-amino acid N-acyltransferase YncA
MRAVVEAVRSTLPDATIDLVPGASDIGDLARRSAIRVHRDLDDAAMVRLMLSADLAIGAGGTSSWERCALGLPSISIRLAPNQDAVIESLSAAGATVDAGRFEDLTITGLARQVASLAQNDATRRSISENAWRLVDGRGAIRVAHAIDGVRVRQARFGDARTLWEWANDSETRAASLDTRPIRYAHHREWLKAVLGDRDRLLVIGWNGAGLLGQVRFDTRGSDTEVSISVAPEHRGTVGRLLLAAGIRRYRRDHPDPGIVARVREGNQASRRLFEGAGFFYLSADRGVVRYRLGADPIEETSRRRAVG